MTRQERAYEEYRLGLLAYEALDDEKEREAYEHYEKSAQLGYAFAQYLVGSAYLDGANPLCGYRADPRSALKWLDRAAKQGEFLAYASLSKLYAEKRWYAGRIVNVNDAHGLLFVLQSLAERYEPLSDYERSQLDLLRENIADIKAAVEETEWYVSTDTQSALKALEEDNTALWSKDARGALSPDELIAEHRRVAERYLAVFRSEDSICLYGHGDEYYEHYGRLLALGDKSAVVPACRGYFVRQCGARRDPLREKELLRLLAEENSDEAGELLREIISSREPTLIVE